MEKVYEDKSLDIKRKPFPKPNFILPYDLSCDPRYQMNSNTPHSENKKPSFMNVEEEDDEEDDL